MSTTTIATTVGVLFLLADVSGVSARC